MAIKSKVISGIKKLKNVRFFGNIKEKFKFKSKEEKAEEKIVSLKDKLLELEERLDSETNIFTRKRIAAKLDIIEEQLTRKVEEKNMRASIKADAQSGWQEKQDEYDRLQAELEDLIAQKEDLETELSVPYEALSKFNDKEQGKKNYDSRMEKLVKNRDKVLGQNNNDSEKEKQVQPNRDESLVSVRNIDGQVVKLTKSEYQDWAIGIEQELDEINDLISDKENQLDEKFEYLRKGFAKDFKEKMSTDLKPYKENIFKKLYNNTIGSWIQGFKDWNQNRKDVKQQIDEAKKQVLDQREEDLKVNEIDRKEARRQNLEKMGIFVDADELQSDPDDKDNKEVRDEREEEDREP